MSDREHILRHAREALSASNARRFDGDNNFKKMIVIHACVVGPDANHRNDESDGGFVFEAKIPRSAVNELGLTSTWGGDGSISRADAAAFLRELADMIEATS